MLLFVTKTTCLPAEYQLLRLCNVAGFDAHHCCVITLEFRPCREKGGHQTIGHLKSPIVSQYIVVEELAGSMGRRAGRRPRSRERGGQTVAVKQEDLESVQSANWDLKHHVGGKDIRRTWSGTRGDLPCCRSDRGAPRSTQGAIAPCWQ